MSSFIELLNNALYSILDFLPGSPFRGFINSLDNVPYLSQLNWFVPVGQILAVTSVYLTAIGVIYTYRAILKYIHVL